MSTTLYKQRVYVLVYDSCGHGDRLLCQQEEEEEEAMNACLY